VSAAAPKRPIDLRSLGLLAAMLAVALALWDWLYPLKLFTVLLHELGHALAAVATGGSVDRIELSSGVGGACWSRGGWDLVVLPAGYLGSMLLGGLILVGASRTRHDRAIAAGIGVAILVVTAVWVRNLFGFVFSAIAGAALIAMARYLSDRVNDLVLRFLGLVSCLYAVFDIKDDLISRTVPTSDASQMSRIIPLPPVVWGVVWIVVAIAAAGWLVLVAARGPAPGEGGAPAAAAGRPRRA